MLEELGKMITVAVVCLSPAVAWASFSVRWRSNRNDIHARRKNQLKEVLRELGTISIWASSEYDESAHSDAWYDPYWRVRAFPSEKVRDFNWREDTALFGEEIFDKLVPLEKAIDNFQILLKEHDDFYKSVDYQFMSKIVHKISEEKRQTNQESPNPLNIRGNNELTSVEIDCVKKFYELNKAIHVKGIGTKKEPTSLHSTFHEAHTYISKRLKDLRIETPLSIWVGHILAGIVGSIGIGFLVAFFYLLAPLFAKLCKLPFP